ncbi:MAG: YlxM family DNA-binding protein [Huintestinicola sp.]
MNGEKDLRVAVLLDYYAPMLTEKQRDVIDLYYNEDLSLGEIAEHESITRQGVRDSIKRGEQTLHDLEKSLALAEKSRRLEAIACCIDEICGSIKLEAARNGSERLMALADRLEKESAALKNIF